MEPGIGALSIGGRLLGNQLGGLVKWRAKPIGDGLAGVELVVVRDLLVAVNGTVTSLLLFYRLLGEDWNTNRSGYLGYL